ncbi:MAG TPA: MarR family transcriptional regulator [Acholeplasmataceae bacterium]|nr:MarR family transcriptional regulator [Acholeplasmataceae bacterium]
MPNQDNLAFKLFESLKKFNKGLIKYDKIQENLNLNDLLVCGLLLRNEKEDKVTQVKNISEYLQISRPAVNTILNRLEDRDIVERVRLKENRRSVFVKLTSKAYDLYDFEKAKLAKVMDNVVSSLGEEKTNTLIELIDKVNNILEEEVE